MPINLHQALSAEQPPGDKKINQAGAQVRLPKSNNPFSRKMPALLRGRTTTTKAVATPTANQPLMGMGNPARAAAAATAPRPLMYPPMVLPPSSKGGATKTGKNAKQKSQGKSQAKAQAKTPDRAITTYDSLLEKLIPLAAIIWAMVLWGYSIANIDPLQMTELGLVSVLPHTAYLAVLLLTFSFTWTLHQGRAPTWLLWLHVASFIFMIHGAPTLIYGTLRYSWAWKHLGIIDFIQRHGFVDPNASALKVYHNWPGFFSLFAYLFEAAGVRNPAALAAWAPVFFNILQVGALALIFKASTNDRRLVWQGIWFYFFANWVGQDYFSPQALNYFLHLVIIGVCLAWFRSPMVAGEQLAARWRVLQPIYDALYYLRERASASDSQSLNAPAVQRAGLLMLIVLLFVVIVTSHQLTPLMTVLAIAALVLFRRCSATSLPLLMGVALVTWIIYGASFFVRNELFDLFKSLGTVSSNISNNLIDLSNATLAQRLVAISGRTLTIVVMTLAVIGCIQRIRQGKWDLSLMLLAFAPFGLLVGNNYGGEILFRVYLFAMPFLAFFMASLLYPTIDRGNSTWIIGANMLLSILLFAGFNLAYYGKDQMYFFSQDEVAASEFLYSSAPPNSLVIEGSRNYPSQFRNYENFAYVPLSREKPENQKKWLADPVDVFARWMRNPEYAATYFIITRSQKAEVDARLGTLPEHSLDRIEAELRASPLFSILYSNKDAVIFTLTERMTEDANQAATSQHALIAQGVAP